MFKKIIQNLLLLAVALSIGFAGCEILLRVYLGRVENNYAAKQQNLRRDSEYVFYEYDRTLGWKNKPFAEGYFTMPDSKTFVKINSKGLRDKEYPYERTPGVKRILVIGDSFTWGYGVESNEVFVKRLEDRYKGEYEVLNAGVSGYGTDQELLFLEKEGYKYSPDIVVVALASNDYMADNNNTKLGYYLKPKFVLKNGQLTLPNVPLPELGDDAWSELEKKHTEALTLRSKEAGKVKGKGLKGILKRNIKTYTFLSKSFKKLKYTAIKTLANKSIRFKEMLERYRFTTSDSNVDLELTRRLFLRMKKFTDSIDAKLIIFIVPYKSALEKLPNEYIADFMKFFKQQNIPAVYPYDVFQMKFNEGEKLFLKFDDHWTPAGHDAAAGALYDFLEKVK